MLCRVTTIAQLAVTVCVALGGSPNCFADSCSVSDQALMKDRDQKAAQALAVGNITRYTELQQDVDPRLSPACRRQQERLRPATTECTSSAKRLVLSQLGVAMRAAFDGDLLEMLGELESLQEALSPRCWMAVDAPQDPGVVTSCSAEEKSLLASAATEGLPAFRRFLTTGDVSQFVQLLMGTLLQLSPGCQNAVVQAQQAGQRRWGTAPPAGLGNVHDHGGGTYSVTGVGACTPSGCIAF